jgi:hypothetical protein
MAEEMAPTVEALRRLRGVESARAAERTEAESLFDALDLEALSNFGRICRSQR